MSDNPQPLHLIQRAVKRLGNQEEAAPPPPARTVREPGPLPIAPEAPPVLNRLETPAPAIESVSPPVQAPVVTPRATAAPRSAEAATPTAQAPVISPRAAARPAETFTAPGPRRVRLRFGELRKSGMITPDNMMSGISHEYRSIKRKLLSKARDPKTRAIVNNLVMITSALPGEGKTFTAVNLALSLAAERDLHVLLIDGDVIHPSVKDLFEQTDGKGLIDLLNGGSANISDVIHRCDDIPNLSVIFAGAPDRAVPELVSSHKMWDICVDISTRYNDRIIIIDSPPTLASTEPANMAMHVHQIIMVVAAGQADRTQLQSALESISACRNVSLLFNKAPRWHQVEGDPYYQYYSGNGATRS